MKSSGANYKGDYGHGKGYYSSHDSHGHEEETVVNSIVAKAEETIEKEEEKVEEKEIKASKTVERAEKIELSEEELAKNQSTLMEKLGAVDASDADDLKVISGIGPKLEGVLNSIGIYKYEQVSKMTSEEYNLLDSITKTFPGRAERDNWAQQAKDLMNK